MTDPAKIAARLDELDKRELTTLEEAHLIAIARAALGVQETYEAFMDAGGGNGADIHAAYQECEMAREELRAALSKLAEGR